MKTDAARPMTLLGLSPHASRRRVTESGGWPFAADPDPDPSAALAALVSSTRTETVYGAGTGTDGHGWPSPVCMLGDAGGKAPETKRRRSKLTFAFEKRVLNGVMDQRYPAVPSFFYCRFLPNASRVGVRVNRRPTEETLGVGKKKRCMPQARNNTSIICA